MIRRDLLLATAALLVVAVSTIAVVQLASQSSAGAGLASAIAAVLVSVLVTLTLTGGFHLLSIIGIVTVSHSVLFIARPTYVILFEDSRNIFTAEQYDESFLIAQVAAGLGLVALSFGYGITTGRETPISQFGPIKLYEASEWAAVKQAIIIVIIGGLVLYSLHVANIGLSRYLAATLGGRNDSLREAAESSAGYLYSGLTFALGAALVGLVYGIVAADNKSAFGFGSLVVLFSLPSIFSGSRSAFIPVAVVLLIALVVRRSWLTSRPMLVVALPVLLVLGVIAPRIWRNALDQGSTFSASIATAFSSEQIFGEFLGGLDTAMVDAFAVQVEAQESGLLPLRHGLSYVALLAAPVPRGIWADKPLATDNLLNDVLFPETASRGIGFAFSAYSEPYANFGMPGVVAIMAIFGVLLGLVARGVKPGSFRQLFIFALVAGYLFALMRGAFTYNVQRLFIPLLPAIIALSAPSLLRHTRREKLAPPRRSRD